MSTFALPRAKPSRKPAEVSLTRLRKPVSSAASRVRWLRSTAALGAAVVDQVGLEPEDRLDPVLAAGLVVLDRAVHHPVVGEPERRHPELGGARRQPAVDLVAPLLTILQAPSSSEYSLWTWRWTTLPLTCDHRNRPGRHRPAESANCEDHDRRDLAASTRGRRGPTRADDASRPLTAKGERQARAAGAALAALDAGIEACLTSPKVRAARHGADRLRGARDRARGQRGAARRRLRPRRARRRPRDASCWSATSPTSRARSSSRPAPGWR